MAAFAPSGISWSGLDAGGPVDAPAWTFAGQPLPSAPIEARSHPLTGGRYSFRGTRAASARARADSWPRVVALLRDALGR